MNMRILLAVGAAVVLVGVGLAGAAVFLPKRTELTLITSAESTDPHYRGIESFVAGVASASGGRLEVKVVPLSSSSKPMEEASSGAAVAFMADGNALSAYVDEFGILDAPYLASGYDGIRRIVTSTQFEGWAKKLHDAAALQVLSFDWWLGERHLWTAAPIASPADLVGSRMRTVTGAVWADMVSSWGAVPVAMPFPAVHDALRDGTINSVEAQLTAGMDARLFEVTKVLTKTAHINRITGLITSAKWFDALPADLQNVLRDEALKAGDVASDAVRKSLTQIESDLAAAGMDINEIDVTAFRDATDVVYRNLGYEALRDELRAIAAAQ